MDAINLNDVAWFDIRCAAVACSSIAVLRNYLQMSLEAFFLQVAYKHLQSPSTTRTSVIITS